jgi:ABC-type antimicrobial peptide transport system permease subunit
MEHPLSKDLPVDDYLLESTDPRWNEPATLHSVRISAVNLNNRIDWVYFALDSKINRIFTELDNKIDRKFTELDNKMDRRFSEMDTKIETRFKNVERNARINYVLSGIIAFSSIIGAIGVFIK